MNIRILALLPGVLLAACASAPEQKAPAATRAPVQVVYRSTYQAAVAPPTLVRGGTVLTGSGARLDDTDVLLADGRIAAIGRGIPAPSGARVIDARGRWVTPGLIDTHSHIGVYPSPYVQAHEDGNEATNPVTANVWVEHSIWPQDPAFATALEGGVTTLHVLPGSANLIGGRTVVLKNVPATTYQAMKFPGAPQGLKMACGENPKRVYGERKQAPASRMANVAGYRAQWLDAQQYVRDAADYEKKIAAGNKDAKPPPRDLRLETLVAALKGELLVQMHCYRADEMALVLDLADEFGYKVTAFHHAVEAYKIADLLAERGVCAAMWADLWGFKMELFDGIQENVAFVAHPANGCAIVHSDSPTSVQRLNQEAAKAMTRGARAGLPFAPEIAIAWVTANPAKALGIAQHTGTLEPGKMADVVIWSRDPFSVYALADQVFVDGALTFDRSAPPTAPRSDFLLGQPAREGSR